jgi:hypothetical protein
MISTNKTYILFTIIDLIKHQYVNKRPNHSVDNVCSDNNPLLQIGYLLAKKTKYRLISQINMLTDLTI